MNPTIDTLIDKLTEFKAANADVDAARATHTRLTNELELLKVDLATTKADLASSQSGLSAIQIKNLKSYEESIFNRSKELEALESQTDAARVKLETLNVEIDSADKHHQAISDSIDSLRQRLG